MYEVLSVVVIPNSPSHVKLIISQVNASNISFCTKMYIVQNQNQTLNYASLHHSTAQVGQIQYLCPQSDRFFTADLGLFNV